METAAVRTMWPHAVCLLCCPTVTRSTSQTWMHSLTHTPEHSLIFNCTNDVWSCLTGVLSTCMQHRAGLIHLKTTTHLHSFNFTINSTPQASCLTFSYNSVWLCYESLCDEQSRTLFVVLWTRSSWWVRVNRAQTPAELLVKTEALIRQQCHWNPN